MRLRRDEAGDLGSCAGVPCLRRKYRGVVGTVFWPGGAAEPVGDPSARFREDGDGNEDARVRLRRRGDGFEGLDASSVERRELALRGPVTSMSESEPSDWKDGAESSSCE